MLSDNNGMLWLQAHYTILEWNLHTTEAATVDPGDFALTKAFLFLQAFEPTQNPFSLGHQKKEMQQTYY